MVEIADFVPHAPVPADIIEDYRGRVPDELIEVWENYGYGTFGQGFLRLVDPRLYEAEVGDCIGKTQGDGIAIPFATTGLGDLITWEPSIGVVGIMYRLGDTVGLGSRLRSLLRRVEDDFILDDFRARIFPKAVAAHGELPYDQSFIFVPLLSMGGAAKVENLHKRETIPAIQVAVDLQGVIGH
jgi:hypothetical protein